MGVEVDQDREVVLSGGFGAMQNSARAGYLPIPLRYAPSSALANIAVYLRKEGDSADECDSDAFMLYRAADVPFTPEDRQRLLDSHRRFIYIRIADQARFREQSEQSVATAIDDPSRSIADKSALVYETSVELINELLSEPDLAAYSMRLENMSRSVATLVLSDSRAFSHLFAASHHDFYTATHMVNVATWMVPLSYALGYQAPDELAIACQAGLLHDIGKIFVPEGILNKRDKLSDADWEQIKQHPAFGWAHLGSFENVHPTVRLVVKQHHERLDGSGYPNGLRGAQIHRISRICAVVDSFDAITALRPFKERTLSVSDAVMILKSETPAKYDPEVVDAWLKLLSGVDDRDLIPQVGPAAGGAEAAGGKEKRRNKRFRCDCPVRVHVLAKTPEGGWHEEPGIQATMHSVSRFGMGLLSPTEVEPGKFVRIYLHGTNWSGKLVHGQTVRCRTYRDGFFEIGVELIASDGGLSCS